MDNVMEWFGSLPTAGKLAVGGGAIGTVLFIWQPWKKKTQGDPNLPNGYYPSFGVGYPNTSSGAGGGGAGGGGGTPSTPTTPATPSIPVPIFTPPPKIPTSPAPGITPATPATPHQITHAPELVKAPVIEHVPISMPGSIFNPIDNRPGSDPHTVIDQTNNFYNAPEVIRSWNNLPDFHVTPGNSSTPATPTPSAPTTPATPVANPSAGTKTYYTPGGQPSVTVPIDYDPWKNWSPPTITPGR